MAIDANHVTAWNAAYARLLLSEERSADLALELDQLHRAAERVRNRDMHPDDFLDFRATLLASARAISS